MITTPAPEPKNTAQYRPNHGSFSKLGEPRTGLIEWSLQIDGDAWRHTQCAASNPMAADAKKYPNERSVADSDVVRMEAAQSLVNLRTSTNAAACGLPTCSSTNAKGRHNEDKWPRGRRRKQKRRQRRSQRRRKPLREYQARLYLVPVVGMTQFSLVSFYVNGSKCPWLKPPSRGEEHLCDLDVLSFVAFEPMLTQYTSLHFVYYARWQFCQ